MVSKVTGRAFMKPPRNSRADIFKGPRKVWPIGGAKKISENYTPATPRNRA